MLMSVMVVLLISACVIKRDTKHTWNRVVAKGSCVGVACLGLPYGRAVCFIILDPPIALIYI